MQPASTGQPAPPALLSRARTGLVVLAALLTEIVVIGAVGNQWVTKSISDSAAHDTPGTFVQDFKAALITYNWRFAPRHGDTTHQLLSQALLILVTLVLSALFIALLVRGSANFWPVFVASCLAVVVATMLGTWVRGATNEAFGTSNRAVHAFFGILGPNGLTFLAAIFLGVIVGLVAGAVAVSTRRTVLPATEPPAGGAPYVLPEQPPPYYGEPGAPSTPPWQERYGPPGRHAAADSGAPDVAPTTQLPQFTAPEPQADQATTRIPPEAEGEQATTRFPRPPDDDDLDHR